MDSGVQTAVSAGGRGGARARVADWLFLEGDRRVVAVGIVVVFVGVFGGLVRVFGSPNQLAARLDGARELRARVEALAGQPSSPNDPAAFLSLLARTLSERAKTLALQQDFAALSRLLVYSGLVALLGSVSLALVYRTDSVTVASSVLTVLVPLVLGVVVAPIAVFAAYILRAATVAYRTVSVGPFIPPEER